LSGFTIVSDLFDENIEGDVVVVVAETGALKIELAVVVIVAVVVFVPKANENAFPPKIDAEFSAFRVLAPKILLEAVVVGIFTVSGAQIDNPCKTESEELLATSVSASDVICACGAICSDPLRLPNENLFEKKLLNIKYKKLIK
jgi:hypothetical protein